MSLVVRDQSGRPAPDQLAVWRTLSKMPYKGTSPCRRRALGTYNEAIHVSAVVARHVHGTFGKTKKRDLPWAKDDDEVLSELPLTMAQGLEFPVHFVIEDISGYGAVPTVHPDALEPMCLMAWEHNQESHRITSFLAYLHCLFPGHSFQAAPIIDPDVLDQVARSPEVGRVTVALGRSEEMQRMDDRAGLGTVLARAPGTIAEMEVVLKPPARKKNETDATFMDWLRQLLGYENLRKLQVDVGGQNMDLLAHKLKYSRSIERVDTRSRFVDTRAAFRELSGVLADERPRILRLLGRDPERPPPAPPGDGPT